MVGGGIGRVLCVGESLGAWAGRCGDGVRARDRVGRMRGWTGRVGRMGACSLLVIRQMDTISPTTNVFICCGQRSAWAGQGHVPASGQPQVRVKDARPWLLWAPCR